MKIVVTTVPFGTIDPLSIRLMEQENLSYEINPLNRKLRPEEVSGVIGNADIVIAGTEPITDEVMGQCPNLKAICRVGIGLDSVDLLASRRRGIAVSYTPDGPTPAVAELTVGHILDLLRRTSEVDREIRKGCWSRVAGRRLSQCKVGIIGCGRIGSRVIKHLYNGFEGVEILANDLSVKDELSPYVHWVDKKSIYKECDVVSIHVPLTSATQDMISAQELAMFKDDGVLVNTSRGGIVNETELWKALVSKKLQSAAVDVFEEEPYKGVLTGIDNVVLTCHLGSMTKDCRATMEIEATQEAIRFYKGEDFISPVPEDEFILAKALLENKT
ncbi:MAG: phosphoglycerate dehydrogenase [Methylocystaceae bacterium]|nr:phosphoglycerate dehydrogenase [Methylocystaceae bacterium]